MMPNPVVAVLLLALPLALTGCVGLDDSGGAIDVEPTGRTVELTVWTEATSHEVYPDFEGQFTAFCVEPAAGSEDAVELRDNQTCSVPGPTIHLQQGDRIVANFEDRAGLGTELAWPALDQATATIDLLAMVPGTHLYTGTSAHAAADGLFGAILVEAQDQRLEEEVDRDVVLLLSHAHKKRLLDPSYEPGDGEAPDVFMINGVSYPNTENVMTSEGDRLRIRMLNAGTIGEAMHLHGHDMLVTHKDGPALERADRFVADTLFVHPGETYDVYVEADNPGLWHFHTHFDQRVTNDHMSPGGMMTHLQYDSFGGHGQFKASPPGGMGGSGGQGADPMPADVNRRETGEVTDAQYSQSFTFPVEDTRAERVSLVMTLTAGTPLDTLTVRLLDAEGNERGAGEFSQDTPDGAITVTSVPNTGAWTATVEGHALGATYTLDIIVDYPDAADDGHGGHGGHGGH